MSNIQNPTVPTPTDPIEIDRAVQDMLTKLQTNLLWLTHGYGRAYQHLDVTQDGRRFYPQVYLGTQNNSQRYTIVSPDNDKTGQCFFFVTRENVSEWQVGNYPFLSYNVALIFSVNLELINSTFLDTDYFQQNLIQEVRNVFINNVIGVPYNVSIDSVDFVFADVFREFDIEDAQQLEKSPLSHFRFNLSVILEAECNSLPFDPCQALLNNITPDLKCNCVIPSLDFTIGNDTDFDCLNATQVTDLTTRLCSTPIINDLSTTFDGVNEYIESSYNAAHEIERTDSFSIDAWVKVPSYKQGGVVSKYDFSGTRRGWNMALTSSGQLRFDLVSNQVGGNEIVLWSNAAITLNTWTHIAVTYDGSSNASGVTVYINGLSQSVFVFNDNLTDTTVDVGNVVRFGFFGS